jgi:hypothetical protein
VIHGVGMASAGAQYCAELARHLRFNAAWPPGVRIALGDIGQLDGQVFMPLSSLGQFGVRIPATAPVASNIAFEYASAGAVRVSFKASGAVNPLLPNIPLDQAGLGIGFSRDAAVVFRAEGGSHRRFADESRLRTEIRSLIHARMWDRDWYVITDVITADSTAAMVSRSAGASVEVSVSADVAAGGLHLLTADAGATVVASRSMQLSIITTGGLTPLFRAKRVRRRWFSDRLELRGSYSDDFFRAEEHDDDLFEDIPIFGQGLAGQ